MISRQFFQETPRKQAATRVGWIVAGVLITALALLAPRPVFSQASAGITGTVTDPSGAVVTGATVTVTNESTNVSDKTTTSSAGTYTFRGLNPGTYSIFNTYAVFAGPHEVSRSRLTI